MTIELDLTGKVVLVTGGTKGVGRGIAARFDDAGATIAVSARNPVDDLPRRLDVPLRRHPRRRSRVRAHRLRGRAARQHRRPRQQRRRRPTRRHHHREPRFTERIVALNLLAPIFCSQRANHWMQQGDGGSIVNISSVSGIRPSPTSAAYGAAKAGLVNFTMTAAMEWAPKVRVNCVTSGMVRTETAHLFYGDEAGIAAVGATVPLGRLALPSEIGDVCVYLASPLASYVTGANLVAHGGGDKPPFLDAANT